MNESWWSRWKLKLPPRNEADSIAKHPRTHPPTSRIRLRSLSTRNHCSTQSSPCIFQPNRWRNRPPEQWKRIPKNSKLLHWRRLGYYIWQLLWFLQGIKFASCYQYIWYNISQICVARGRRQTDLAYFLWTDQESIIILAISMAGESRPLSLVGDELVDSRN